MNKNLDQLVDHCLGDIQNGRHTLEACLEQHPDHATDLGSLLRLSAYSHATIAPSGPSAAYVEAARARIINQLILQNNHLKKSQHRRRRAGWIMARPAYALVALALVITLFGSGFGVLHASAASLPGDGLYGIKLARERIQLTVSLTPEGDQALLLGFAEERLLEAETLLNLERYQDLDRAMQGLDDSIEALLALEAVPGELDSISYVKLEQELTRNVEVLHRVLDQVPESARNAIEGAIERSNHNQDQIKNLKAGEHPSNSAPGQLKKIGDGENQEEDRPGKGNGRDKEKPEKPVKTEKPDQP